MLGSSARSAADLAAEMRREFEAAVASRFGTQPQPDPVLGALFQAFAVQLARIYQESEYVFPVAVLDDLLNGLALPARLAHPAQTVVTFSNIDQRERLALDTELIGSASSGEQIRFTIDESIEISAVTLAFAGVYENGRLSSIAGARVGTVPILPGSTPLALRSAPPTLLLAFDGDAAHLSGLGLFLDVTSVDSQLIEAVARSPWQILSADGAVSETGTLRAKRGRGGVTTLVWNDTPRGDDDAIVSLGGAAEDAADVASAFELSAGSYGRQCVVFPPVPAERRTRSAPPARFTDALQMLLPEKQQDALDKSLIWVQVPLPAGLTRVADELQRIALHAVTASNIEIYNERIQFDRMGSSVTLRPEGRTDQYLLGLLSVSGEKGDAYVNDSSIAAPAEAGRYRFRSGQLECRPHKQPTGRFDGYAMARFLFCDGARANGIEVGAVKRIASPLSNVTARVANLAVSRGGSAPPPYVDARIRFAELLRTRDRVVTIDDVEITARAFEPRIKRVDVSTASELGPHGMRQVDIVDVRVAPSDFADPDAELPRLGSLLQSHLQQRVIMGRGVRVTVLNNA
ncbi:MAG TPA: hypothetical protein VGO46_05880 [Gemmatimonadaceae bacterium]|nr:hypothetical protein [Gemmatimonadaceae bacterium]